MAAKREPAGIGKPRVRPATTPEAREQQLGSFAYDLAERQLLDGSASAQVITYFLKSNSVREKLELERLKKENLLTEAKIASAGQADRMEGLLTDAMRVFTEYKGGGDDEEDDEFY